MDGVLGPAPKMDDNADESTPMMSQFFALCEEYDDSLVRFQVGDFSATTTANDESIASERCRPSVRHVR